MQWIPAFRGPPWQEVGQHAPPAVQPSHHLNPVHVEVAAAHPYSVGADLVAVMAGPRAAELGAPRRAIAEADPVAIVYRHAAACAMPLAVVEHPTNVDGLRTGAARAVAASQRGETVAWALDPSVPLPVEEQVRTLTEGAVIGGYDAGRWRSDGRCQDARRL